jgi:hypothetical protein
VRVKFGEPSPYPEPPPEDSDVGVVFRVARRGTGSGTVRGTAGGLDCGRKCSAILDFGSEQTLVADPDHGSRFVRWRGACATAPRCTLAVGPVTRVTALFAKERPPVSRPTTSGPLASRPSRSAPAPRSPRQAQGPERRFIVLVGRRVAVRGVRPRRVTLPVRVNARSSIRLVLEHTRGHLVSSRTWEVRRGRRVLRLRVPARARRGTYVLRIKAQDRRGHVKGFERRVRLRR